MGNSSQVTGGNTTDDTDTGEHRLTIHPRRNEVAEVDSREDSIPYNLGEARSKGAIRDDDTPVLDNNTSHGSTEASDAELVRSDKKASPIIQEGAIQETPHLEKMSRPTAEQFQQEITKLKTEMETMKVDLDLAQQELEHAQEDLKKRQSIRRSALDRLKALFPKTVPHLGVFTEELKETEDRVSLLEKKIKGDEWEVGIEGKWREIRNAWLLKQEELARYGTDQEILNTRDDSVSRMGTSVRNVEQLSKDARQKKEDDNTISQKNVQEKEILNTVEKEKEFVDRYKAEDEKREMIDIETKKKILRGLPLEEAVYDLDNEEGDSKKGNTNQKNVSLGDNQTSQDFGDIHRPSIEDENPLTKNKKEMLDIQKALMLYVNGGEEDLGGSRGDGLKKRRWGLVCAAASGKSIGAIDSKELQRLLVAQDQDRSSVVRTLVEGIYRKGKAMQFLEIIKYLQKKEQGKDRKEI